MSGICDGRVVIVTGAGRGIGREHALEFARQGAAVVVNDLGAETDGTGRALGPAQSVVEEICAAGGRAIANGDDVSDFDGAGRLVQAAIDEFGRLDVLLNNAGILRDRMLVNMSVEEFDSVVRVHLRGTFCTSRHAAQYWRDQAKAGHPVDGRLINTTSASGLFGNVGQANYGAAKGAIASMTIIASRELARYGVTVNAVAPAAVTRMTENLGLWSSHSEQESQSRSPDRIAPLVVWLGSAESKDVTGRVFYSVAGQISVVEGWVKGPTATTPGRWDPAELGEVVGELLAKARPPSDLSGRPPSAQAE